MQNYGFVCVFLQLPPPLFLALGAAASSAWCRAGGAVFARPPGSSRSSANPFQRHPTLHSASFSFFSASTMHTHASFQKSTYGQQTIPTVEMNQGGLSYGGRHTPRHNPVIQPFPIFFFEPPVPRKVIFCVVCRTARVCLPEGLGLRNDQILRFDGE